MNASIAKPRGLSSGAADFSFNFDVPSSSPAALPKESPFYSPPGTPIRQATGDSPDISNASDFASPFSSPSPIYEFSTPGNDFLLKQVTDEFIQNEIKSEFDFNQSISPKVDRDRAGDFYPTESSALSSPFPIAGSVFTSFLDTKMHIIPPKEATFFSLETFDTTADNTKAVTVNEAANKSTVNLEQTRMVREVPVDQEWLSNDRLDEVRGAGYAVKSMKTSSKPKPAYSCDENGNSERGTAINEKRLFSESPASIELDYNCLFSKEAQYETVGDKEDKWDIKYAHDAKPRTLSSMEHEMNTNRKDQLTSSTLGFNKTNLFKMDRTDYLPSLVPQRLSYTEEKGDDEKGILSPLERKSKKIFNYVDLSHHPDIKVSESNIQDVDNWISRLLKCQPLSESEIEHLCTLLTEILAKEDTCVRVATPVTVAGDIHGQIFDLFELFKIGGLPPDTNYLFLGDYVDRGFYSCETFCLVASFKIRYPSKVTILRGNHESRQITQIYGFYDECLKKYGSTNVWKLLTNAFDYLPMAALIDHRIFCDHGGISSQIQTIADIEKLNRFQEVPQEGVMVDLLWSDPAGPEEEELEQGWKLSPRGAGVVFSQKMTEEFLHRNNLECICRAHQLAQDGHVWQHDNQVVTVFSAPNYCYRCGNAASIMTVDEDLNKSFISFESAPARGLPEKARTAPDYFL